MRTFADALREARGAVAGPAMRGMAAMEMQASNVGGDELEALEARIIPARGPAEPDNPRARCDYCPRVTLADRLIEVQPGRFACDGCTSHWDRVGMEYGTPIRWREPAP